MIGCPCLPSGGDAIAWLVGLRVVALWGEGGGDAEARHGQGSDHETGRGDARSDGGDHRSKNHDFCNQDNSSQARFI